MFNDIGGDFRPGFLCDPWTSPICLSYISQARQRRNFSGPGIFFKGFLYALPHFISPEYTGVAGNSNGSEIDFTLCNAFRDPDADICDNDHEDGISQARFYTSYTFIGH